MSIFDTPIDRRGRRSIKYDFYEQCGKRADAVPLWVADMDFSSPPNVLSALHDMADHGVLGYSWSPPSSRAAVAHWFERIHGWRADPDWLIETPGVMFAIATIIQTLTQQGDAVLIQEPVYYPFREAVERNNRRLVVNELVLHNEENENETARYEIDFDAFESQIQRNKVRLFLLCSPHNPGGRVWSRNELMRMAEICKKWNVLVVSDEIHADLVYSGNRHTVFATLPEELAENCIVCTSPSKTFNLSGLHAGNMFVRNETMRTALTEALHRQFYYGGSLPATMAAEVAYTQCDSWYTELLTYLEGNRDYLIRELLRLNRGLHPMKPEGTFLLWLDCRALGLNDEELDRFWSDELGLWLHRGTTFGQGGNGFMRLNFGCPRSTLEDVVRRLS